MTLAVEVLRGPDGGFDLEPVPNSPGVFLIWPSHGAPYIGKTALLRRRLDRLLRRTESAGTGVAAESGVRSKRLNLAGIAERAEYQASGSTFESMLLLYRLAKRFRPADYRRFLKLRPPVMLKLNLSNSFPRCYVTRRLSSGSSLYFGPFRSRASAERFQNAFLDLFLIRRCRDEIVPNPSHPGCIYGEMKMCLRPCQAAVTREQYLVETKRVGEFLSTRGESLLRELEHEREAASTGLEFEQAARVHKRMDKAVEVLRLLGAGSGEIACDLDHLYGVIVQRSTASDAAELWFLCQGGLQTAQRLSFAVEAGQPQSLDGKLRDMVTALRFKKRPPREKVDHLALVLRWHSSSYRQGEMILFDGLERIPYRKIVRAFSRVMAGVGNISSTEETGQQASSKLS